MIFLLLCARAAHKVPALGVELVANTDLRSDDLVDRLARHRPSLGFRTRTHVVVCQRTPDKPGHGYRDALTRFFARDRARKMPKIFFGFSRHRI